MNKNLIKKLSLTKVPSDLTKSPVYRMPDGTLLSRGNILHEGAATLHAGTIYFRRTHGDKVASCHASTFFLKDADMAIINRFLLRLDVQLGKLDKLPEFKDDKQN